MTLGELKARVWDRLDEDSTSPGRFTSAIVREYLNDAVQDMLVRAGALIGTTTITAVANQYSYELPHDCVQVVSVDRNNVTDIQQKVWPRAIDDIDEAVPNWRTFTSDRFEWYFIFGLNQIFLLPAMAASGTVYDITYRKDPGLAALILDTQEPDIPRRFHDELVEYAVGRALLIDADSERLSRAVAALRRYELGVQRLRRTIHRTVDRTHRMRPEDSHGGATI